MNRFEIRVISRKRSIGAIPVIKMEEMPPSLPTPPQQGENPRLDFLDPFLASVQ